MADRPRMAGWPGGRIVVAIVSRRAWAVVALAMATGCSRASDPHFAANPPVSIAIGPASLDPVDTGSTVQFSAVGTYRDGTTREITTSVTWASSDPAVASVSTSGLLSPDGPGTTSVSASVNGVSATAVLRVAGFATLDAGLVEAPAGYVDNPAIALDGRGHLLLAYGINDGTVWPAVRSLVTRTSNASWPPTWVAQDAGIVDAWQTSAPDVLIAANATGVAGMVYGMTSDSLNGAQYSFGVSYYDGSVWKWTRPWQGTIGRQMWGRDGARTPIVAVDPNGKMIVAYQGAAETYPLDELSVARFDPDGSATVTTWPEYVGDVYVATNASGQVMVLNTFTGSRLFDGEYWGTLEAFPQHIGPEARLTLDDAGNAVLFGFDAQILRFRRDASGWSAGEQLQGATSSTESSGATNDAGRSVIAYVSVGVGGGADRLVVRVLDGDVVGPERVLDDDGGGTIRPFLRNPKVMVDGGGRFVVLWERGGTTRATWFDGTWHTINNLGPAGTFVPAIAMRPDGMFVIVSNFCEYNGVCSATFALRP